MARHKELIDHAAPFKVVAAGFPVMRFSDVDIARKCFRAFRGPGACLLISYEGEGTKCLGYKFMKR